MAEPEITSFGNGSFEKLGEGMASKDGCEGIFAWGPRPHCPSPYRTATAINIMYPM